MLNTNVLHRTKPVDNNTVQLLHVFDSALISEKSDSRIDQKYISPLISEGAEMMPLTAGIYEQKVFLDTIREVFCLSEQAFGYEIKLREAMSDIWVDFLKISVTSETSKKQCIHTDITIKKKKLLPLEPELMISICSRQLELVLAWEMLRKW